MLDGWCQRFPIRSICDLEMPKKNLSPVKFYNITTNLMYKNPYKYKYTIYFSSYVAIDEQVIMIYSLTTMLKIC